MWDFIGGCDSLPHDDFDLQRVIDDVRAASFVVLVSLSLSLGIGGPRLENVRSLLTRHLPIKLPTSPYERLSLVQESYRRPALTAIRCDLDHCHRRVAAPGSTIDLIVCSR